MISKTYTCQDAGRSQSATLTLLGNVPCHDIRSEGETETQ